MRGLDSSLLRVFVTLAETGAVSGAATRLARTMAAAVQTLKTFLRKELNTSLAELSAT
jgi:DNA-binding transcriptional LysR family regulator